MNKTTPENIFLDTKEFIRLTDFSVRSFRRKVKSGELPVVKSGNRLLIPHTALPPEAMKAFLESSQIVGNDETQETEGAQKSTDLKPWQRKVLDERLSIVEGFRQLQKDIPKRKLIEFKKSHAKRHGISIRSLDNYLRLYEEGGAAALVPGWTNGVSKKIINAEMRKFIERKYLQPHGPSMRMVYENLCIEFKGKVNELPAYRTVTEFVNCTWTKATQLLVRDKALYDKKYSPFVRRDWEKAAVNECWVGDAKQIDVACLHNGKVIFPWFTAFLDARSRKFVGWVLTAVHDSLTIGQAFAYAVAKHGAPEDAYIDRGKPYRSKFIAGERVKEGDEAQLFADIDKTEMPGIMRDLGTSIFYAAPYNAREKIIEPNFRIFTYRFTQLPGYRGHSIKTRPEKLLREIKEGKLLTLDQLSEKVDQLIKERNARPHSTTKQSPDSAYDGFTPIIPSQDILDYLLMDRNVRRVKDGTVSINGFLYRGEKLWELAGEAVEIRRDPRDLRRAVIVYKGKAFCIANLEIPGHYRAPITVEHAKTARRIRADIKKQRRRMIDGEAASTDPVKLAAELAEANRGKPRDIRPAQSKIRGFHSKERLARDVREAFTVEPAAETEQAQAVAGGDILTRFAATYTQAKPRRQSLSLENLSGTLSIYNRSNEDD